VRLKLALQDTVNNVPDCVAAGYVNIDEGRLVELYAADEAVRHLVGVTVLGAAELFEATNYAAASLRRLAAGDDAFDESQDEPMRELMLRMQSLLHLFMRCQRHPQCAVIVSCAEGVSPGIALSQARLALPAIEAAAA
jgi:hypothetical protein